MKHSFKRSWAALRRSRPGRRFQDSYERSSAYRAKSSLWQKIAVRAAGLLSLLVGVFFVIFPGPGIPFLVLGAAIFARESLQIARVLDWIEVKLRALFRPLHRLWKKSSLPRRVAAVASMAVVLGGGACFLLVR